jgi:hypothetical protein
VAVAGQPAKPGRYEAGPRGGEKFFFSPLEMVSIVLTSPLSAIWPIRAMCLMGCLYARMPQ